VAGNEGRAFYVFHPAFGYVADAYGLEQVAIEEHGKEPGAGHVSHVIDLARASNARVVFVQPQFASMSAEMIAAEISARVVPLDPLPENWVSGMLAIAAALEEALAS
jgi:zinc transport system substrate-binding protein